MKNMHINSLNIILAILGLYLFSQKWVYIDYSKSKVDLLTVADDNGIELAFGTSLYGDNWGSNPSVLLISLFYLSILVFIVFMRFKIFSQMQIYASNVIGSIASIVVLGCEYARITINISLDKTKYSGNYNLTFEYGWWFSVLIIFIIFILNIYLVRRLAKTKSILE